MSENRFEQHLQPGAAGAQGPYATATVNHFYGMRLPTIGELPGPATPDLSWLMAQPSRLLDARSQVVPFIGRRAELEGLREWRDADGARLSVLLLHGPGGQGKTRLAMEFAERSRSRKLTAARRWHVLSTGFRGTASGPSSADSPAASPPDCAGVLLVVDYADRWAHSELERLLSEPVLHQQRPTRVLLIGRSVRWFAALRGELSERRAATGDVALPPLSKDRLRMFGAARDRYAGADLYGLADAAAIEPPGFLEHGDFGLTLNLHMAALVTVDARSRGERPSLTEPHELSAYLLDREYRAWQRLFDAGAQGQDYRTRPSVMAKTVFTATLTGAVGHDMGSKALRTLDVPGHPQDLLLDHRFCYPPTDRELVLEPLYPDRLAEDFLGLLVPGHDISAYEPDPWASGVPAALLADGEGLRPTVAGRLVTFLAAAGARWTHLREKVLYPLLRAEPGLAIESGSSALIALAALADTSAHDHRVAPDLLAVLEGVEDLLPPYHVDLNVGILAITEVLVAHRLHAATDPAERAWHYRTLARRRARAGRTGQAIAPAEEAVRLLRELARDTPYFGRHLATTLDDLSDWLSDVGRREEAFDLSEESVAIRRGLVASDPATTDPATDAADLAGSLATLGLRLSRYGRHVEALELTQEAADLYRQLVRTDPGRSESSLSGTLSLLGMWLLKLGRSEEALAPAEEAVAIQRRLTEADPGTELPNLAAALGGLADVLWALKRGEEALAAAQESIVLYRQMVVANPMSYEGGLTTSLVKLSRLLAEAGRKEEALGPAEEAVAIQRRLAESDMAAHRLNLARSLNNLGRRLDELGRGEKALGATEEATHLYGQLADAQLATALPKYTKMVSDLERASAAGAGRREDALAAAQTAADLSRQLAGAHPARGLTSLAASLSDVSRTLAGLGRFDEAVTSAERATTVHHQLGDHRAAADLSLEFGAILTGARLFEDAASMYERAAADFRLANDGSLEAAALSNLGGVLAEVGRADEGADACEQAVAIYWESGEHRLEAVALTNLSRSLTSMKRYSEVVAVCRRALVLFQRSGYSNEAQPLHNLGNALLQLGRFQESLGPARAAAAVYREKGLRGQEADSLSTLGTALYRLDRFEESATAHEQAVDAYRDAGDHGGEGRALSNLGGLLLSTERFEAAVTVGQQALALLRVSGDRGDEAAALTNLGIALGWTGRFTEAVDACERAIAICRETGNQSGEADALANLNGALTKAERFEEAVIASEQAAATYRRTGNRERERVMLGSLGSHLLTMHRLDEAITAYQRELAICRETGDLPGEAELLQVISLIERAQSLEFNSAAKPFSASNGLRKPSSPSNGPAPSRGRSQTPTSSCRCFPTSPSPFEGRTDPKKPLTPIGRRLRSSAEGATARQRPGSTSASPTSSRSTTRQRQRPSTHRPPPATPRPAPSTPKARRCSASPTC